MNKNLKHIFIILISALLSTTVLTGCDGIMSNGEDGSRKTSSAMGYLSLSSLSGAIESTAADSSSARTATTEDAGGDSTIVSPTELTKASVAKVVLKSNSQDSEYQTLGTWTSDSDATETSGNAITKLYADSTIAIPVDEEAGTATYTFYIELYDSENILLGSGTEENVEVTAGKYTALSFKVTLSGDGAIRVKNCFTVSDRVTKIEAGIFDADGKAISVSDTETLDYEELAVFTADDNSTQYAYYVAPEIAAGSYIYTVRVYGTEYSGNEDNVGTDKITGTYSYVINIDEGLTTYSDSLTLSNINTIYRITYKNMDKAEWVEGASPSFSRNNYKTTILPTASSMYREYYGFDGWYDNEECKGEKVTTIAAEVEDNAKDMVFYAKWEPVTLKFESVTLHTSKAEDLEVSYVMFNSTTVVAQASSTFDFDHYKWFVNNEYQPDCDDQQNPSIYIQFLDGGTYDITVHASKEGTPKDSSAQVKFKVTQLPDFPITYKNGDYLDFTTGEFTGTHEETFAPVFYYGGTTVLDEPSMVYYDFGGYYITSALDQAENSDDAKEISAIKGTDYEDEITLYAKWNPKNPLTVTIPENSVQNFEKMSADKDLKASSSLYVLGNFEDKDQWYTYEFYEKAENNLSADLRSNLHRTGADYYGFYPSGAISSYVDAKSTETKIALSYACQKQTATTNTLASYDFMTGKITGTDLASELNFARLGEKLTFNLTGVPADKTFKQMVLYVPDTYIPSTGYVDMSEEVPAFVCNETIPEDNYNHFMMDLDLTSSDGTLAVSVMLPPFNASGKTVIVTLVDSDGNYYNAYFTGENYAAGTDYVPEFADTTDADLKALPQYIEIGGKKVCPYNYGAYSPEDYGELYTSAQADELALTDAHIPTRAEWTEIAEGSDITAEAVTVHGVHGIKFTATDATELFVPANGYSNASTIVRNSEVNLLTNTTAACSYTYILHGTSEKDENGVMAYGDAAAYSYGLRLFY